MKLLENFLVAICFAFFLTIYLIVQLCHWIGEIFKVALVFAVFIILISLIAELNQPWQSICLRIIIFGLISFFISLIALALWKPKRLTRIIAKFE